jgi:hypothetical protein
MKITTILLLLTIPQLFSCSDDNDAIEVKTNLLVDVQWWNSGIIGTAPSGYPVVSPLFFKRDKNATIGGSQVKWTFIENGRSVQIKYSNYSDKYEIINLSETEFHFKHYDSSGNFLIELKYDKCSPISIGGC